MNSLGESSTPHDGLQAIKRISSYYARPASYSTGGVNRSRQEWMAGFGRAGLDVTLLNASNGYTTQILDDVTLRFLNVPHAGRSRRAMVPIGLARAVAGADVVYLHEGWTASNLSAGRVLSAKRIPYVVMPHGVYERDIVSLLKRFPGRMSLERRLLEGAAAVHVFFESEIDHVLAIAPKAKVIVAPTAVSAHDYSWEDQAAYLSWVGRFDIHHKGLDLLVEAMKIVSEESRPLIRMVGPDHHGDKDRLRHMVEASKLENWISIEEPRTGQELESFVANSRAFIHVPRWECLGRTVVDALTIGAPVLLTETAHIARPLHDRDLATVTVLDPHAIATALQEVWARPRNDHSLGGRRWAVAYFDQVRSVRSALTQITDAIANA